MSCRSNLGLLSALGLDTSAAPEFPLETVDVRRRRAVRGATGGRYALLNPGAAWPNKRWPPARFGAWPWRSASAHGLRSVVLWGPGEESSRDASSPRQTAPRCCRRRPAIADLVALARGAALMVSGDTGPMHIAAAVGTPLVGIYGPTRPERNGPWRRDDITVSRAAICECHHLRQCRPIAMCLMDIGSPKCCDAVERRLGRGRSRRRVVLAAVLARLRVPLGFVFGAARAAGSRNRPRARRVGAAIAAVGEALRIWAAGHLDKAREVTASGPVSMVRASAVRRLVVHRRRPRGRVGQRRRRGR